MSSSSNSPLVPAMQAVDRRLRYGSSICDPPPDDAAPQPGRQPASSSPTRETVLVVDDDRDVRAFLRLVLEDMAYVVLEASDGLAALAVVQAAGSDPLIVLTDYQMPHMDGGALLRTVLEDPALAGQHAFALMTARASSLPSPLRDLLAEHDIPILVKPFRLADLEKVMRQCEARG